MKDEFNLPLSIEDDFEKFRSLQKASGVYSAIMSEAVCIVSKYPKKVHRNGKNFAQERKNLYICAKMDLKRCTGTEK